MTCHIGLHLFICDFDLIYLAIALLLAFSSDDRRRSVRHHWIVSVHTEYCLSRSNLLAVARNGDLHLWLHTYHPHHQIRDECKEGEIDTLMAAWRCTTSIFRGRARRRRSRCTTGLVPSFRYWESYKICSKRWHAGCTNRNEANPFEV